MTQSMLPLPNTPSWASIAYEKISRSSIKWSDSRLSHTQLWRPQDLLWHILNLPCFGAYLKDSLGWWRGRNMRKDGTVLCSSDSKTKLSMWSECELWLQIRWPTPQVELKAFQHPLPSEMKYWRILSTHSIWTWIASIRRAKFPKEFGRFRDLKNGAETLDNSLKTSLHRMEEKTWHHVEHCLNGTTKH
jgi:hypothetical protein